MQWFWETNSTDLIFKILINHLTNGAKTASLGKPFHNLTILAEKSSLIPYHVPSSLPSSKKYNLRILGVKADANRRLVI